ncbi:MAG: hypothetical protein WBY69_23550 [Candidatus Acidiferrales bacterium]
MHTSNHRILFVFLAGTLLCAGSAGAQTRRGADQSSTSSSAPRSSGAQVTTVDQAIDRVVARERDEIATISRFTPVMEVYIQDMKPSTGTDTGAVPAGDHYFLGSANLAGRAIGQRFLSSDKEHEVPLIGKSESHREDNFVQMAYVDPQDFDREHYRFEFVRRELLGEVRCFVFDVMPLPDTGDERFSGRIWAEDQNFTIVRINGVHGAKEGTKGREVHFDSWRLNLEGSTWLPAYIYTEESVGKERAVRFKSQTRFWGYGPKGNHPEEDVHEASASSEGGGADDTANPTIRELEAVGLLAPRGELDHIMEIVVNNLEVTNNLDIQPEIRCRTLLTTTLESFSAGHTIVLSRGLLDALPDEPSLAAMLAQEMATILVKAAPAKTKTKTKGDVTPGGDVGLARLNESGHFLFKYSDSEIQAANQKAFELMRNSPYKNKLDSPGSFLEQVGGEHKVLTALISPRVGDRVNLGGELAGANASQRTGKSGQPVAVRMGTRVKLDPWSNQVTLLKAKPAAPVSAREYDPFELFPFFPFLTRDQGDGSGAATHGGATSGRKPSTKKLGSDDSTPGNAAPSTPPQ